MNGSLFHFWNYIADMLYVFSTYLFFETILEPKENSAGRKYGYVVYWIIMTVTQLIFALPLVGMLVSLIVPFALTFFYTNRLGQRLLAVIFIEFYISILEMAGSIMLGVMSYSLLDQTYTSVYSTTAPVLVGVFALVSVLIYRKITQHRGDVRIPFTYWLAVIFVPVSSSYVLTLIYGLEGVKTWQLLSILVIMLAITLCVFLLYEKQLQFFQEENREKVLEVQNAYYQKQLDYIMTVEKSTRSLRHDIKNHLLSITALAEKKGNQGIINYIKEIYNYSQLGKNRISTGNVVIDSIINNKLLLAEEKEIEMTVDITIPADVPVNDIDITVLLGNLLDNAIENVEKTVEKTISLSIKYDKGRLFICCENPYNGVVKRHGESYDTVKNDTKNHGFGIQGMKAVVNKYSGTMHLEDADSIFRVEIILYMPA